MPTTYATAAGPSSLLFLHPFLLRHTGTGKNLINNQIPRVGIILFIHDNATNRFAMTEEYEPIAVLEDAANNFVCRRVVVGRLSLRNQERRKAMTIHNKTLKAYPGAITLIPPFKVIYI